MSSSRVGLIPCGATLLLFLPGATHQPPNPQQEQRPAAPAVDCEHSHPRHEELQEQREGGGREKGPEDSTTTGDEVTAGDQGRGKHCPTASGTTDTPRGTLKPPRETDTKVASDAAGKPAA